ncbi:MFS transporter [Actinocorallia sp. API 0066]|uniref:MFS transporter n=1 Tax=Actinocorallia sp. API 0066 TaxID=2896846 RepID=UPI001E51C4CA|nr:MFS transporter [Actinocorallia sp. API 0066]MCD0452151.1 MFS transporter [Actinocorallia sp. API 0066]
MTQTTQSAPPLPLAGLLALATGGFITVMTEALPAGVLPAMSADLAVSESAAGQTVTIYAIGSAVAAVPLTAATAGWPRRRLLLLAIAGFAVANTVTATSTSYPLTMAARLLAGVVAGLLWALLAGYARRMVSAPQRGRAMAIAMAGIPVALSVGIPAGTFLAGLVGWRWTFGIMTVLSLALLGWVALTVPAFPGASRQERLPLRRVLRIPGVAPVLAVTLTFVLAHNLLYTYIAPFLEPVGLGHRVDAVLLTFGVASLVGLLVTGTLIDTRLRHLMVASCALFAVATLGLALFGGSAALVYVSAAVWGLGTGGVATLVQTASAEAAGDAGDVAQSLIVTSWNIAIGSGALLGGALLTATPVTALPWWALPLILIALLTTARARHAFVTRTP